MQSLYPVEVLSYNNRCDKFHGPLVTGNSRRRPLYSAKGLAVMNLFVNACGLFNTYLPPVAIGNVGWR